MRNKIQFWADGYLSYRGWGKICESCGGDMHPGRKPDPAPDCPVCNGMGGSPLSLCPSAYVEEDIYAQLLYFVRGKLTDGKIHPIALFRAIQGIEIELRDHPEDTDAAWTLTRLRGVAEFAKDLGTNVACK